jgi:predicted NUDIX family NTP pyrophosphohydrolase
VLFLQSIFTQYSEGMNKDNFCAKVLMYRYEENQLQVFVEETANGFTFPDLAEGNENQVVDKLNAEAGQDEHIPLDPVTCEVRKRDMLAYAFEIDWRKLPKSSKRRQFVETNKGVFIAAKEAMKKNMPAEYKMMKELVEVLSMRNIIKNL